MLENLKNFREDRGITVKEMAEILGIHPKTYANYESGKRKMKVSVLVRISTHFDISTDYLIGQTDNPRINR